MRSSHLFMIGCSTVTVIYAGSRFFKKASNGEIDLNEKSNE